jgi:hypothetical protein
MRPGHETSMHYFYCSGGTGTDSIKSAPGHGTLNFFSASSRICGSCNAFRCVRVVDIDALFLLLRWARYRFYKKCSGTRYAEPVFLHAEGSIGHIVHSGAFGARNFEALFVMLRWDRYRFYKKRDGTRYTKLLFLHPVGPYGSRSAFRCVRGTKCRCTTFHA